jgi:drug/metabolite transporter (DMT)-like permease
VAKEKWITQGLLSGIVVVGGAMWPIYAVMLHYFNPLRLASLRLLCGSVLLFIIMRFQGKSVRAHRSDVPMMIVLTVLWIVIPYPLALWGVKHTTPGIASVLAATTPFFVALFSYVLLRSEPVTAAKVVGLLVGFSGIALIFTRHTGGEMQNSFWGNAAIIGCTCVTGLGSVLGKQRAVGHDIVISPMVQHSLAGVTILLASFVLEPSEPFDVSGTSIAFILYLGIVPTLFNWIGYFWLQKRIEVVKIAMTGFLVPIVSMTISRLLLDETFAWYDILGAALVIIGVVIVTMFDALRFRYQQKRFEEMRQ